MPRCAASFDGDSGEGYDEFLMGLAQASGIETPTRQELVKLDRKRQKKGSNQEWKHPHDPDARITKMKDGRTHLATQSGTRGGSGDRSDCSGHGSRSGPGRYDDDGPDADRSGRAPRAGGA